MAEQLTTYTEDFEVLKERLHTVGAENVSVPGTVVDDDVYYRAAYHLDTRQEPPVISQLLLSPTGKSGALTRTTVAEDEPHMSVAMVMQMPGFDVAVQLDLALMDEQPPLKLVEETETQAPFTYVYDYVRGFEPDVNPYDR